MFRRKPLVSVDDAQRRARRRLPRGVYDFVVGGSEAGYTLDHNLDGLSELTFRPRYAVAHERRNLATTVLGCDLSMPVALAPAGQLRPVFHDAERAAARAAARAGIALGLSTFASTAVEDIMPAAGTAPVWYQLYFSGGRAVAEAAVDRARDVGCKALFVTIDSPRTGYRESAYLGNGLPHKIGLSTALRFAPEVLPHPLWLARYLRGGIGLRVPNIRWPDGRELTIEEASLERQTPPVTWSDFRWIKQHFGGPVVAKGVLTAEDARRAVDAGADAIVVSNHGGYMLDSAPSTIRMLPEIVDAVGDQVEVLVDGGIRRGADVVKAMALGARAVLIGRAYVWALAAAGEQGVDEMLALFRSGIDRTLALIGCDDVASLDRSYLNLPREHLGRLDGAVGRAEN
jgi:isopentenyl diphosphate isomerase/L-lactate dehydrogenase-like FMN-dependent dehydrogenase